MAVVVCLVRDYGRDCSVASVAFMDWLVAWCELVLFLVGCLLYRVSLCLWLAGDLVVAWLLFLDYYRFRLVVVLRLSVRLRSRWGRWQMVFLCCRLVCAYLVRRSCWLDYVGCG